MSASCNNEKLKPQAFQKGKFIARASPDICHEIEEKEKA